MRNPIDQVLQFSSEQVEEAGKKHPEYGTLLAAYRLSRYDRERGSVLIFSEAIVHEGPDGFVLAKSNIQDIRLPDPEHDPIVLCRGVFCEMYEGVVVRSEGLDYTLLCPLKGGFGKHIWFFCRWLDFLGFDVFNSM